MVGCGGKARRRPKSQNGDFARPWIHKAATQPLAQEARYGRTEWGQHPRGSLVYSLRCTLYWRSGVDTDFRDPEKYTLWWISDDKQASLFFGNFDSYEAAEADIYNAQREFESVLLPGDAFSGFWDIDEPEE
jgi:hypothetical protein